MTASPRAAWARLPPRERGRQTVADRLPGERQRVRLAEDDEPVPGLRLGDVSRRETVLALYAAERVLRGQLQRPRQGVLAGRWGPRRRRLRTARPQRVEDRLLQRPAVGHPPHRLPLPRLRAPEPVLQPAAHALRRPQG